MRRKDFQSTPLNCATGSTAGKEPGSVVGAGAVARPPSPEAGPSNLKRAWSGVKSERVDLVRGKVGKSIAIAHHSPKMRWDAWKRYSIFGNFHPFLVGIASFFKPFAKRSIISWLQAFFERGQDSLANLGSQPCISDLDFIIQFGVQ